MSEPLHWPPGSATGVGSMPGDDVREALRVAFGEVPDLPYLPELPARGPGADLVGRTAAFLVDLHVDLQPSGWRLVDRPGRDVRRARDLLERDLDALEEAAEGYAGALKVAVGGPWTLAATAELPRGDKALADPGAVRDLTESLAEGVARYAREVRRRVPGARLVVQVDEPALPNVLSGRVPTASGFATLRAVEGQDARAGLARVLSAFPDPAVVHCCAPGVPVGLLREAGADAVSLDASLLSTRQDDDLGAALESGLSLFLGLVPVLPPPSGGPGAFAGPARALWNRLGLAPETLPARVVVTPTCGTAGASPDGSRDVLRLARETARALADDPEGGPGR